MADFELPREVVLGIREGDPVAFEAFVERFERPLYALAFRLTREAALAADLTQEIFWHLLRQFAKYDPTRPLAPWVFQVARNKALNLLRARRRKNRERLFVDVAAGGATEGEAGTLDPPGEAPPPDEAMRRAEVAERVRAEVANLAEPYRSALVMHYLEGMTYETMVAALALPLGTVKNRLFRAREMLKERLQRVLGPELETWLADGP